MGTEIQLLFLNSCFDSNPIHNILLRSVFDSYEAKSEVNILAFEHTFCVGTFVHNINFCDNTNCSYTFWIKLTSHLKTIRCSHICVCRQYTKNEGSWISAIPCSHIFCNFFDVFILTVNWDSCNTRQIHHRKIWTSVRENVENNWFINNVLLLSADFICQEIDCFLHFLEVSEFFIGYFLKFCPRFNVFRCMIQSQLKWSSRHNTLK